MKRRLAGICLLASLTGCVRLSQPAPLIREYRLDYAPPSVTGLKLPVTLRVSPLAVAAVYDREPIVYRLDAYSTGTYVTGRWSTNPGAMLADLLARDLSGSGLYSAVEQASSSPPGDYQLSGRIDEIEERAGSERGTCAAHLQLRLLLSRQRASAADPVLMQKTYADDAPSACNDPRAVAAAMSAVVERLSAQLQHDVYDAIARDRAARPRK